MAKKTHLKMRAKCTVVFPAIYFLTISAAAVVEVLDSLMGCDLGNICAKAER
jgi:hypothetical protein